MNTYTSKSNKQSLLHGLGVLMATASQYTNLSAIHEGETKQLKAIKPVKGDADYNVLSYAKDLLKEVQTLMDVEQELNIVFEGFLTEASLIPCPKSELKTYFHLMYEALTHN